MKSFMTLLVFCFFVFAMTSCDTQKPAEEVEDAKGRVEKKVQDARDAQEAENPEAEEKESD
ncbi:MAG TPA: hypothetical protein VI958_00100 [Acidobacteriota bacterium]